MSTSEKFSNEKFTNEIDSINDASTFVDGSDSNPDNSDDANSLRSTTNSKDDFEMIRVSILLFGSQNFF